MFSGFSGTLVRARPTLVAGVPSADPRVIWNKSRSLPLSSSPLRGTVSLRPHPCPSPTGCCTGDPLLLLTIGNRHPSQRSVTLLLLPNTRCPDAGDTSPELALLLAPGPPPGTGCPHPPHPAFWLCPLGPTTTQGSQQPLLEEEPLVPLGLDTTVGDSTGFSPTQHPMASMFPADPGPDSPASAAPQPPPTPVRPSCSLAGPPDCQEPPPAKAKRAAAQGLPPLPAHHHSLATSSSGPSPGCPLTFLAGLSGGFLGLQTAAGVHGHKHTPGTLGRSEPCPTSDSRAPGNYHTSRTF